MQPLKGVIDMKKFIAIGYAKLFEDSEPCSQFVCVNANDKTEAAQLALVKFFLLPAVDRADDADITDIEELTDDTHKALKSHCNELRNNRAEESRRIRRALRKILNAAVLNS